MKPSSTDFARSGASVRSNGASRRAVLRIFLIAPGFTALVPLCPPALAGPELSPDNYLLTGKTIDQWLAFMRGVQKLAASDPALALRLKEQRRKERRGDGDEGASEERLGARTEEGMRREPKIRMLVEKIGLRPAELELVTLIVPLTAMAVQLRKEHPAQSPKLKPGSAEAKNFALVEARLAEITKVMSELSGASARGRSGKPEAPPDEDAFPLQ